MPRACSLCIRSDRHLIDQAIREGVSIRVVAGRFDSSRSAIQRHSAHVIRETAACQPSLLLPDTKHTSKYNFISDLLSLKSRSMKWLESAEEQGNYAACVVILREIRRIVEMIIKVALAQRELEKRDVDQVGDVKELSDEIMDIVKKGLNFDISGE